MKMFKYKIISFVFILFIVSVIDASAEKSTVTRMVAGIGLGMSLEEVEKIFQLEEKEDGLVNLMRKAGFGDPDKRANIYKKLGKREFAIKNNFPKDVNRMEVLFRNDILYGIALHYGKEYVQRVDWDLFTIPAINKYGEPRVSNHIPDLNSFSYHWSDGQTAIEIGKSGTLSSDKSRFTASIYNVFYKDIKIYNLLEKDEKNLDEELTALPSF